MQRTACEKFSARRFPWATFCAFSAVIHGCEGNCPCCLRPFADPGYYGRSHEWHLDLEKSSQWKTWVATPLAQIHGKCSDLSAIRRSHRSTQAWNKKMGAVQENHAYALAKAETAASQSG